MARKTLTLILFSILLVFSTTFPCTANETEYLFDNSSVSSLDSVIYGCALGHNKEPINAKQKRIRQLNELSRDTLPSSLDLSDSVYFPPIDNQGGVKSCTSWATTYYQFTYQVARMNGWNAHDYPEYRFSPRWTYNFSNKGMNSGSNYFDNYYILKQTGAARCSEFFPYAINTPDTYIPWLTYAQVYRDALKYRITDYTNWEISTIFDYTPITNPNSLAILSIKDLLYSGHIVTFSTDWSTNYAKQLTNQYDDSLDGQYAVIYHRDRNHHYEGHSMSIVGYDDNIWYDLNQNGEPEEFEKGALKIANSHGTGYMNSGFVWVMYDALNKESNATNLNYDDRDGYIDDYDYYTIEIEKHNLDLSAEVTLYNRYRSDICLETTTDTSDENSDYGSFLRFDGGNFNFEGGDTFCAGSFVFDYGTLNPEIQRSNVYLRVEDSPTLINDTYQNIPTTIQRIRLVDRTGKVVVDDTTQKVLNNQVGQYPYRIGMVGDVNNDAQLNYSDMSLINGYLAGSNTFSYEDMIIADTDGDGYITIFDASHLQRYIEDIISEMDNGVYAYLS